MNKMPWWFWWVLGAVLLLIIVAVCKFSLSTSVGPGGFDFHTGQGLVK